MKLQTSRIIKYLITFLILTSILYYFSDRFDNNKAKFSKVSLTFVKNESDGLKQIELLSQEIKFLCYMTGYNACDALDVSTLSNIISLIEKNISPVINPPLTDVLTEYANDQLTISYTISNDLLGKNRAIQESIQEIPKKMILEHFGKFHYFLANKSIILNKHKDLFSAKDNKKNNILFSKNIKTLSELESSFKKFPYMQLKETKQTLLFRSMSNILRLVLSAVFALIAIFYTRQIYTSFFRNRISKEM